MTCNRRWRILEKDPNKGPTNVTNALFVGSTAELSKLIKNQNKDDKWNLQNWQNFLVFLERQKRKKEEFDNLLKEADINLDVLASTVVTGIKEVK